MNNESVTKDLLKKIETYLKKYDIEGFKNLQAGISLDTAYSGGLHFSKEIYDLYDWHNGTGKIKDVETHELYISNFGVFYSFEFSMEIYNYFEDLQEKKFFPIWGNGDTLNYYICLDENSLDYNCIFIFDAFIFDSYTKYFQSLEMMLGLIVEYYSSTIYSEEEKKLLTLNPQKEKMLNSKFGV